MCLPAGSRCSGRTSPPHGRCVLHSLCEGGKGGGARGERRKGGRGGRGRGGNYEEKGGQEEHAKYILMLSSTSHLLFLLLGVCQPR